MVDDEAMRSADAESDRADRVAGVAGVGRRPLWLGEVEKFARREEAVDAEKGGGERGAAGARVVLDLADPIGGDVGIVGNGGLDGGLPHAEDEHLDFGIAAAHPAGDVRRHIFRLLQDDLHGTAIVVVAGHDFSRKKPPEQTKLGDT